MSFRAWTLSSRSQREGGWADGLEDSSVLAEDVSMSRMDCLLGILRAHGASGAGAAKLGAARGCVACLPSF